VLGQRIRNYLLLVIVISVAAVFLQVVSFDFLKYDDTINISENPRILNPNAEHLLNFWQAPFLNLYIPVTYTVWSGLAAVSIDMFNGRLDPGLFHLCNLMLHAVNCLLVFFIIKTSFDLKAGPGGDNRMAVYGAVLGALVFGLHPVQVETVSWVTGLKGVLGGTFSLGAIALYIGNRAGEKHRLIDMASAVFFILAVLSMPSAVIVPVMLFLILLWAGQGVTKKDIGRLSFWLVLSLIVVVITRAAQPVTDGAEAYPWRVRPLVAADALMFYLHKIVWPGTLAIDYCRTPARVAALSWKNPYVWASLPLLAAVCRLRRQPRLLALGAAFLAGILPVSGVLPFAYQQTSTVADRYLYLSMAVVGLAVAAVVVYRPRPWVVLLSVVLVLTLGLKSFDQCRVWKNTETIMGHTLRYYPCSFRANLNYGIALMSRGELVGSIPYLSAAQRLRPNDPLSYYNLGIVYAGIANKPLYERQYQKLSTMDRSKAARLKRAAAVFAALPSAGNGGGDVSEREKDKP